MAVKPLTSVLKTLATYEVVAASAEPMRLADVARQTDEPRGAAHQRLVTLIEAGLLETDGEGRYRLTLRSVAHAAMALEQANLGARLGNILSELVDESGETASLAVLDGTAAVIARRIESRGVLRADLRVGTHLALDWTASGRVLAAWMTADQAARLRAAGGELPPEEVSEATRAAGFAITEAEKSPRTVAAVAAPLFDPRGRCVGALTLSGPFEGFDTDRCAKILIAAARRAASRLKGE